jgi:hypothetical protein
VWSVDPASYAGGSLAAGTASHTGQVKGDGPDTKGYPGPPGWGLGEGWQPLPVELVKSRSLTINTRGQGAMSGCRDAEENHEQVMELQIP